MVSIELGWFQVEMNGRWYQVVLVLIGLIVGGGLSTAISSARISKLEAKHDREMKDAENIRDRDYDVIMEMSRTLVRIETKVDALTGG